MMRRGSGGWSRRLPSVAIAIVVAGSLSACGALGGREQKKLPGERISVLTLENKLQTDPTLKDTPVTLPPPVENAAWAQPGGNPTSSLQHLALGDKLSRAWSASAGEGEAGSSRILSPPIVADGKVFAMDAHSTVSAFDASKGAKLWSKKLAPEKEDENAGFGGGLAWDNGRLFAASGFGFVVALDPATGKEIWRHEIGVPLRAAPVATDGRVYVISEDNQLFTLSESDGREQWNFQGIVEPARLLGNPSVAVVGDVVIVPFSSGELYALRVENGRNVWSDSLTRTGPQTALSTLSDIAGRPVVEDGVVYAVSHSGRMAGIDLRSGQRVWAITLASADTPWVAGDFIYVISADNELVCLTRAGGGIKWVSQLPRYEDPEDKTGPIEWSGPILAGGRLLALSSKGKLASISPLTGKVIETTEIPNGTFVPPIVAGRTLYVLTGEAELLALR